MKSTFNLEESDFDADAPCLLDGPKTVTIGGDERVLQSLDADIVPRTGDGRLVVDGKVNANNKFYDFDAAFTITYDMVLDDIPANGEEMEELARALHEAKERDGGSQTGARPDRRTAAHRRRASRAAGQTRCDTELQPQPC